MKVEDCSLTITIPGAGTDAHVSIVAPDGISKQKTVSVDDIVANLASSYRFSTGLLPKGTRFFSGSLNDYLICIEMEERVRKMRSVGNEERTRMIPFPKCLFIFFVRSNKIIQTYIHSLKKNLESDKDTLYHFPFGNVYQDGHVCWGGASLMKVNQPMELVGIINIFLDSGFNGDLIEENTYLAPSSYKKGESRIRDFWSLLNYLEKRDAYPSSMLKRSECRYKSIINSGD